MQRKNQVVRSPDGGAAEIRGSSHVSRIPLRFIRATNCGAGKEDFEMMEI
jgi:hypothetical protein